MSSEEKRQKLGCELRRIELSQGATTRAVGLGRSVLQANEAERDAAASLQQLSALSGPKSDHDDTTEALAARHQRVKVDVSYLAGDKKKSSDYGTISAGDSDNGVVNDDDQEPDHDGATLMATLFPTLMLS